MKTVRKILALFMAVSAMAEWGAAVSAQEKERSPECTYTYQFYNYATGMYYGSYEDAYYDEPYGDVSNLFFPSEDGGVIAGYYISSDRMSSLYPWYNSFTHRYYKTAGEAANANIKGDVTNKWEKSGEKETEKPVAAPINWISLTGDIHYGSTDMDIPSSDTVSAEFRWCCMRRYYRSPEEAYTACRRPDANVYNAYRSRSIPSSKKLTSAYPWYNPNTRRYYTKHAYAVLADGSANVYNAWNHRGMDYSKSYVRDYRKYTWYNARTGFYYITEEDAMKADPNGYIYLDFDAVRNPEDVEDIDDVPNGGYIPEEVLDEVVLDE